LIFVALLNQNPMDKQKYILETSMKLFMKYGIRAITMDRISDELGISKRTIYELFRDKDDLIYQAIRHFAREKKKETEKLVQDSENVIHTIFQLATHQAVQMREVNPQFAHDLKKYHARVFRILSEDEEMRDYSLTRKFLNNGMKQGLFRTDLDMDIVNKFLHLLIDKAFGHETDPALEKYSHRELFDNIFLTYIRGISTEKGIQLLDECRSSVKLEF